MEYIETITCKYDDSKFFIVPIKESKKLLLCAFVDDFMFDGYLIMDKKMIAKRGVRNSDKFCSEIMKAEGAWKLNTVFANNVSIDDWRSVIKCLVNQFVGIEDDKTKMYWWGKLLSCDAKYFELEYYDGVGEFRQVDKIKYKEITRINLCDRYTTTLMKYIKPRSA